MGYAHGTQWDNQKIIFEIEKAKSLLDIQRMPTNSELRDILGNYSLSNAISKRGGFLFWAEQLKLSTKKSDSKKGWEYESIVLDLMNKSGIDAELTPVKHPYDIFTTYGAKIDVKASKVYKNGSYVFRLVKTQPTCDFYCLCCVNEKVRFFIIPSILLCQVQLNFYADKWKEYEDKWELIKKHDNFLSQYI